MKEKIKKFYKENKKTIIIVLAVFVIICIALQVCIFYLEKLTEKDLQFNYLQWSESCDGKNYTLKEKREFCNNCSRGGNCLWPLDMDFTIGKVKRTRMTGGEIHCYMVVDDVNYYSEKGSYYGITEENLFTWVLEDASEPHKIEFCCGIERLTLLDIVGIEKKWPQACVGKEIKARCI